MTLIDRYMQQLVATSDHEIEREYEADVMVAKPKVTRPPMYAVVFHNDDYTPMDFVLYVLEDMFNHNHDSAMEIMLTVHNHGKGIAGIFPRDIAETKSQVVNREARQQGYPLLSEIEPVNDD